MDIYNIIVKSLIGEIDSQEEEYFTEWLASHPDNKNFYQQLKKYWEFNGRSIEEKKKEVWSKIHQQIGFAAATENRKPAKEKTLPLRRIYWVAASIALVVSSVLVWDLPVLEPKLAYDPGMVEKSAGAGQNLTIRLPDGSQVKLNAESYLKYPEAFSDSLREVHLIGEAFFKVEKDQSRPFIIHTADIQTTVKGTSFNIEAYPNAHTIEVAVESGLVEVKDLGQDKSRFLISKNQAVVYDKHKKVLNTQVFSPDMISWKDGVIVFDKASFEEIVDVLERWYGVDFNVLKKVDMGDGFVGRFENKSLNAVIESISYAGGFSFKIEKKVLTVY